MTIGSRQMTYDEFPAIRDSLIVDDPVKRNYVPQNLHFASYLTISDQSHYGACSLIRL